MTEDVPTGVGTTAVGVAAMRAAETRRPDRLFEDPLAAAFVAGAGWGRTEIEDVEPARRPGLIALAAWVSVRTRFLDDLVLDATASGVRQVVLLGAGLDARGFRLQWPDGVRVFELDTPAMLAFKQRVLDDVDAKPRSERIVIPIDLRENWPAALNEAGFDSGAPAAWVVEGLLVYLDEHSVDRVMRDIAGLSAPGSRLGVTSSSSASIESLRAAVGAGVSSLWISALPEDIGPWMASYGWTATARDARELLADHGRPSPRRDPSRPPSWLIDGRR